MANELIHKTVGTQLTQSEYDHIEAHKFNNQAIGDLAYASSADQLSKLGIGTAGQVLEVSSGIPAWTAAITGATSILNTALVIGRDADNDIDFATDNTILFRADGADQIKLTNGALLPVTDDDIDLGSSSLQFKDGHFDGTVEADAITVGGTAVLTGGAETAITSILNTSLVLGRDADNDIDFGTDNNIIFRAGAQDQIKLIDGALAPVTDNDVDLGTSSLEFKDAFFDGTVTSDAFAGPLTGDVTGNADTATALATGRTIGMTGDVVWTSASFTGAGNVTGSATIQSTSVESGMLNNNIISGQTEITSGLADADELLYSDGGVLKRVGLDTLSTKVLTGNAASATILATARAINGVDFDGSAAITVTAAGSTLSDTVPVSKGGTNATSLADKAVLITQDSGTDTVAAAAMSTNGQLLIGGTSGPAVATLTQGSNVTITNSDGAITIAAASGSNTMGDGWVLEDGDGTEVTITENKEVKFVEGNGIDINWTDTDNGTDADPYDLTFTVDHDAASNFVAAEHYDWSSDISGTATIHANNVTDLHGAGVDGSANQLLTDDGDGTVTSESGLSFTGTALSLAGNIVASGTSDHQGLIVTPASSAADDALGNQKGIGVIATMRAKDGIAIGELLHIDGDGDLDEAHADATADMPAIAIALEANDTGSDGNIKVLLQGFYRDDSQFSFGTVGVAVYADHSTEGDFTLTASSTDGHFIQRVGISATDDMIYFNPSLDVIERD